MKVLLLCLKGFEFMEFSPFIDIFGWGRNDYGFDIDVITCGFNKQVYSAFGVPIMVDTLIENVDVKDYAVLAIPGGFEEFHYYDEAYDERTSILIQKFNNEHKIIASVCVGALPVAKSGVLYGKTATTYHLGNGKRRRQLAEYGVNLGDNWMVTDGNIITSSCPMTASDVAFKLLEMLTDEERMIVVKKAMGFC